MAMANSDLKASVLMNLRSVTQSRKGGVPLKCLERDYKDLLGTPIPFRDLGYTSIQAFLTDIPDVISLRHKDGQLVAEGVADSTTAHIVSLVNRQKTARSVPKVSRRTSAYPRRGAPPSRYSSRNVKSYSPKRNSYRNSSTKPDTQHSKPQYHEPADTRPKVSKPPTPPPPSKVHHIPPRKYDIPPRFLRLQQQKNNVVEDQKVNNIEADFEIARSVTPDSPPAYISEPVRADSPPTYISEPVSNNYIRSPRPLQTARNNIEKSEPVSKRLELAATSKEYIKIYAESHNLVVHYKSIMSGQKKRNRGYFSSLTLGQKKYDSYPEYAATAKEAEEIAASVAVQAIQKDHLHLESCTETTIRNAEDVQKLISRIEEVVCEKPSGMFTNGIVHEYEINYHESLPENWLSLLQQSSILEIEELDVPYGRVPEGVNCIVRRAKFSSGSTTPSSLSEFEQRSEFSNDDSAPRPIVRKDHLPAIPELTIPFGNQWFVYVVDVSKTIAARLIDYDEPFIEFLNKMRAFYSSEFLPAQEISEGLLYASCLDDNFQRVLAQTIKDNDLVECYYVDDGVFADVPKSCLQELHSDFWTFPYQAIHLTLDGLEDYPYKPDDLDFLRNRTLVALVKRWSTTVLKYFPDDPAVHKIIYSVELYDTESSEDINLNDDVKEKMLESLVVKLPKLSVSSGGYYLSHVEDSGEIYLRNISDDSWLEEQLEKLSPSFEEARLKAETIPHDMIFAARYEDGLWYRAVLTPNPSSSIEEDKVEVYFIDYGNKSIVSSDEICRLQPFSEFLSIVGPQAIKCELYSALPSPDAEWTSEAVSKLMELAPISEELLIRVITEGSESALPQVNLYKRTYQNGDSFIISINESLANKPELFKTRLPTTNSSASNLLLKSAPFENNIPPPVPRPTSVSRFPNSARPERSSSSPTTPSSITNDFKWVMTLDNLKSPDAPDAHNLQPLKLTEVPDIGQIFDVFVTMSANPDIFYIQPLLTNKETTELAIQMDQFYSSEDNLIEMELSLLKVNEYYAVRHSDGHWYRSQLQSIISDDPVQILVNYVDYGDLLTVNMSQLQSLYSNFRHLPCQAIKASLAGIKPVERDWRPLHCVEFKSMVEEKVFSSIVRKKTYRESRGNKVLELELTLIDVSVPGEDVYIHEILITKGIARPA